MRATGSVSLRSVWFSFWPWMSPFGQQEVSAAQAERKFHEEVLVLLLATKRELGARWTILERVLPVERAHDALDVVRGEPGGIEAADDGAHAGARDRVDRDVQLIEHLQHADMRGAARAAAGEHKADAGPARVRGRRRGRQIGAGRSALTIGLRIGAGRGVFARGLRGRLRRRFGLRAIFGCGLRELDGSGRHGLRRPLLLRGGHRRRAEERQGQYAHRDPN